MQVSDFMRNDYDLSIREYRSMSVNDRINLKAGTLACKDALCIEDFFEDNGTVWLYYGNPQFYIELYTQGISFDKLCNSEIENYYS